MKVILYMATTPNGLIAKENDDTGWVTKTEWASFRKMVHKAGNMIIGRRTYEIMLAEKEFSGLENVKVIVVTDKRLPSSKQNVTFAKSPEDALRILAGQGVQEALVCGGGTLNGAFMKSKLVDEIYLDIEPTVFGKGIPLFGHAEFEAKLELVEVKRLSKDEIQLHYRVLNS